MSFPDFIFPEVQQQLELTLAEQDLFSAVPPDAPDAGFIERMRVDVALAVNTEKARSEFIIAPVPGQLRREMGGRFGLFSGVEFDVDVGRGLNGFCDFILTRSPLQTVLTAPDVAVVEAKNDNLRGGLGQCIAAMVAAREFNAKAGTGDGLPVHGVVTTGSAWKFLRLDADRLTIDTGEYSVADLPRVMGILLLMAG